MKKVTRFLIFAGIVSLLTAGVISCKKGGATIEVKNLKGETLIYIIGGNGSDYIQFTFGDDGTSGTWETMSYTFGYSTAEDETSGKYTDKRWFENEGYRGGFTFNETTYLTTLVYSEVYTLKDGATTTYEKDYEWRDIKFDDTPDVYPYGHGLGPSAADEDSVLYTEVKSFAFSPDKPELLAYISQGEESNDWVQTMNSTREVTQGGITNTYVMNYTMTNTISENSFVTDDLTVETVTLGDADPEKTTSRSIYTYNINDVFLIGEVTGDNSFEDIWKEGNAATFLLERTKYESINYTGDTPPEAPDPDETSGYGETTTDDGTYTIWLAGGYDTTKSRSHEGMFLLDPDDLTSAFRGLR